MAVKLDLTPDVEAALTALAQAQGLSLEAYVEKVLRERSVALVPATVGAAEKARAFRAWAKGHRDTPPLSDEAIRRDNLVRNAG